MSKPKILVTVPNTGAIHRELVKFLLKLQREDRYDLKLWMPSYTPLENAQHHIVNEMAKGDYQFWLSIDSDTVPQGNPLDLVELNRDVIGLPYQVFYVAPGNERKYYWAAYVVQGEEYGEHKDMSGLQIVDAIGGGCFLASARVFLDPEMQKGCFTRKLNPDGTVRAGNDIAFCERARAQGFKIFTHYGYHCKHYKTIDLTEIA